MEIEYSSPSFRMRHPAGPTSNRPAAVSHVATPETTLFTESGPANRETSYRRADPATIALNEPSSEAGGLIATTTKFYAK